jgi:hypothetical protein
VRSWFRGLRLWIIVVSSLGVGLILFLVIRTQGRVSGFEFAPSHFQQRQFEFFEIPWIHLQVTPIKRSSSTPDAAQYIRQNGLITVPPGQPTQWHLVSISRGLTGSTLADGQLLTRHLNLGGTTSFWRKWSEDHPQSAAALWPIVQQIASRELYVLLPRTFELALQLGDSSEFATLIDQLIAKEYLALIREARAAGRDELAQDLLSEAEQDHPDNSSVRALRAEFGNKP